MKPIIIANWKCNPLSVSEVKKVFNLIKQGVKGIKNIEIVLCPPFLYLLALISLNPRNGKQSNISFGSQNCFWEKSGAFTGEVSPEMIKNAGCRFVILGHSERRRYFGESDEMVNRKLKAALSAGLKPIFCIGETAEERNEAKTSDILAFQIENGIKDISSKEIKNLVIAYEPVWAIGTGNPCPAEEAQIMSLLIRKILNRLYGRYISKNIPIIYGGSVNSKNAASYIKDAGMQGLLVGGASLNPTEFKGIIKSIV